jgi:hypothetical protein
VRKEMLEDVPFQHHSSRFSRCHSGTVEEGLERQRLEDIFSLRAPLS